MACVEKQIAEFYAIHSTDSPILGTPKYQLNETAARASEQRSERIVEPGEYIGILTCAEDITSKRGARGIDCVFETENKHIAYFTLWTFGTEGKELFGYSQLNALMTCLGIK